MLQFVTIGCTLVIFVRFSQKTAKIKIPKKKNEPKNAEFLSLFIFCFKVVCANYTKSKKISI